MRSPSADTASCRVAAKAGFALEGTLRESNLLAEGFADTHLHAREALAELARLYARIVVLDQQVHPV